ncbi:hypothetical protein PG911_15285 [Tenacibaculum ovolyticum]|uniref:hypothetical protein n=1 Tax=Tenacibaculum ovolyticum TaxID=104270 RepID=UPI0022F3FBE5|nr:hypothetical protein [Tenacibaculum ovolyticum]WBX75990.1 hypothetical protein PG911_15285 [Tenacibaculum ovolyticum]
MQNIHFPVNFEFKTSSLANDFTATDSSSKTIAYVRQKMFKLKEDISVYDNETKSKINYKIKADKWLDFSTAYSFSDDKGLEFGKVVRKGWRSIWNVHYQIIDQHQKQQYVINEENPWVKVLDSLLGEIPILNFFTGYFFNPTYLVKDMQGKTIVKLKKLKSFLGKSFEVSKVAELDNDDDDRVMLALMMFVLLERRRG